MWSISFHFIHDQHEECHDGVYSLHAEIVLLSLMSSRQLSVHISANRINLCKKVNNTPLWIRWKPEKRQMRPFISGI